MDAVDLVQDSIHIRIMFCCPGNVTLEVGYRTGGSVCAALTGNRTSIRGEDFQRAHMRPNPRPPIISLINPVVEPEGQAVMPGTPCWRDAGCPDSVHDGGPRGEQREPCGYVG
nr:MAG TPA: hypothetical protein [Caudoviricetes sp.]